MLRVVGGGATNAEGIRDYLNALAPWIADLRGAPWATLGIVDPEGSLLTPDAEAFFLASAPRLHAQGRVAMALVCPRLPGSRFLRAQWQRVYAESGTTLGLFEDEAEARRWLVSQLRQHGVPESGLPQH
jgi:hypothetical protein